MRKQFFLLIALVFGLAACNENAPISGDISVQLVSESVTVPITGGTVQFEVAIGKDVTSWTATADKDWVTITPSSGTEKTVVTVKAARGLKDFCTIEFRTDKGSYTKRGVQRGQSTDPAVDPGTLVECTYKAQPISVSATKRVLFSRGNLQYQGTYNGSLGTFRFAEHQYDYVGNEDQRFGNIYVNDIDKCSNTLIDTKYMGWIDLFGWGTSGYRNSYPYLSTTDNSLYGPTDNTSIAGTDYDWGVGAAISSSYKGGWRTLTIDEWEYMLNERANAHDRCAYATVNNTTGFVFFPDTWSTPADISINFYNPSSPKDASANKWTLAQWAQLEALGAVFLPAVSCRVEKSVQSGNFGLGYYWSSTADEHVSANAQAILFRTESDSHASSVTFTSFQKSLGLSVRLVKDQH